MNINRIYVATILYLSVFCLVGLNIFGLTFVSASLCQILYVSLDYPQIAQTNQQILLTTTITGVCAPSEQGIYYLAMVYVEDTFSGHLVSISSTPIGYIALEHPHFTSTVSNPIVAPSSSLMWRLEIIVYVVNAYNQYFNSDTDTSLNRYVTITVGSVQTSSATTTSAITTTATTTTTATPSTNIASPVTTPESTSTNMQVSGLTEGVTLVGVALVVIFLVTLRRRGQSSRGTEKRADTNKEIREPMSQRDGSNRQR